MWKESTAEVTFDDFSSARKDREGFPVMDVEVEFENSLQCRDVPIL